jgi:pyruvate dehydrogenase E2 component (dihydrolipoamide acetyltransferase)
MSDESAPAHARGHTRVQELTRLQTLVARRAAETKATIPDFLAEIEVDLEAALARLAATAAGGPSGPPGDPGDPVPEPGDLIVHACARALREHPRVNGSYRDGRFELHARVNVGVAVSAADLLLVPTIPDADGKDLTAIAQEAHTLAERVRSGTITPPELAGGTFTVHDLRGRGRLARHSALITPPQAACLAVGAITPRAIVVGGALAVRRAVTLVLSCDHRILYAADAADFLETVREILEQP